MDFAFRFAANNSSNTGIETAGSLANNGQQAETVGSLAFVSDNCGGFDSFGTKDVFGSIDFSNMNSIPASAFEGASSNGVSSPISSGFDFGGCASSAPSVGADCGSSSGGGSFSSIC